MINIDISDWLQVHSSTGSSIYLSDLCESVSLGRVKSVSFRCRQCKEDDHLAEYVAPSQPHTGGSSLPRKE